MRKEQLHVKVPGKLMVAGEYAVLEPHYELIVMAVDRFVYATLTIDHQQTLTLENFHLKNMPWSFTDGRVQIESEDRRKRFVRQAMDVALNFLQEKNITSKPFSLSIKSELDDDASGRKYGLGSSAAVVTAVISIILKKFAPSLATKENIFKLSAIAHISIQKNGSGADIAASTYGGMLLYTSFQADWLMKEIELMTSLTALVEKDWYYLTINPLKFPTNRLQLCVGWTGEPASTKVLVDNILLLKEREPKRYEHFLKKSEQAVTQIVQAIKANDDHQLFAGFAKNHIALATLGKDANVPVETPLLKVLAKQAKRAGGVGKLSGAGGGDCGIAFVTSKADAERLCNLWKQENIQPLPLSIESEGATVVM